nr:zinc finger, CCHC-type [Tanacetum cinerariifolium]
MTGQRHRSTAADHGGDRRSTVAVNDGRQWRTTVDCRWTTVDHHRSTVVVNSQRWVWAGSGSGLAGSGSGLGRVRHVACHMSATCAHVLATCAHVASTWMLTWILNNKWESNTAPLASYGVMSSRAFGDPKIFDEAMKYQDVAFEKEAINDELNSILG